MSTTSVIGYYGSKHSIAPQIVNLMPAHRGYVEPYAGSLSVLAAKPPSPFECVNDLDQDLMTFWRVLRDRCDELERLAALTPHSRAEYAGTWPPAGAEDDLTRAWRVWVQLTQGRGGQLRQTGWRYHEVTRGRGSGMPTTLAGYVGRFAAAAERLRNVSLECLPALDVIDRYGRDPQTVMYVDPPYLGSVRGPGNIYRHELREPAEHVDLAVALHACQATVLLSGYASPLYDNELYADWHRHEITAWTGQGRAEHKHADGVRTEVLWSNRPIALTDHGLFDLGEGA